MIRIHHLTDTHFPNDHGRLTAYCAHLRSGALGPDPHWILHTGDIVDGAESAEALRSQHLEARGLLEQTGIPYRCLAHNHDRVGESDPARWGSVFQEVYGQPLLQALILDGLELFLLSGAVSASPAFMPPGMAPPPPWGYDVFDPHVLSSLESLVEECSRGGYRVLCTHLPVLLPSQADHSVWQRHRRRPIGEEGVGRILPVLRRLKIRSVWSGHLHAQVRHFEAGIDFIVGPGFIGAHPGFGEMEWSDGKLQYRFRNLPPSWVGAGPPPPKESSETSPDCQAGG